MTLVVDQCPHCGIRHVQTTPRFGEPLFAKDGTVLWNVVRCQNADCLRLILVQSTNRGEIEKIFPFATHELESPDAIPTEIADDFREAGTCLGAACYKASLVMSRRVLQRSLKAQGCDQHNLVDAITHAVTSGILRKAFHPLADEIRQYGNLGAHPDDDQLANANRECAQHVLGFARLLIHEFFEVPASAAALKLQRQRKPTP